MKTSKNSLDMFYKTLKRILGESSKTERIKNLEKKAENGDVTLQVVLGDIYFYGIDTNHNYIKDLDKTIALAKYSAKNKGRVIGLCCYCNQNPDYALALKWYEMAAKKGSKKAQDKIKEIQTGAKKKHKNFIIQTFEIQCNYY
ncbi:MAG: sel1 repeat family protein [Clostridia bacterium]|nr:sel1 repeat family protein [Clostridia bacterium]